MESLEVTKMDGAGNSFIVIDILSYGKKERFEAVFSGFSRQEIARKMCQLDGKTVVDGLVLIEEAEPRLNVDFQWDFYNADGSVAEMCGNAARCVARFATEKGLAPQKLRFQTIAGVISAIVKEGGFVELEMTPLTEISWNQTISTSFGEIEHDYIDSGVPHCVIRSGQPLTAENHRVLAMELRQPKFFAPKGANITFIFEKKSGEIESFSFERGVEDFTLACGTGAVAAAASYLGPDGLSESQKVQVEVPGGQLVVTFKSGLPFLYGPTQIVSEKTITSEDFRE